MPASRIAFAFADFVAEIKRLLPRDDALTVKIALDSVAFDKVVYQLAEYGGIARQGPGAPVNEIKFGGVVIERMLVASNG